MKTMNYEKNYENKRKRTESEQNERKKNQGEP